MPLVDNVAVYKEQTDFGNHLINDKSSADPIQQFMQEASSYPSEDFEKGFMMKVHKNDFVKTIHSDRCKRPCHQLLHVIALAIAITSAIAAIEIMVGISHTTLQRAIAFTRIHGCSEP